MMKRAFLCIVLGAGLFQATASRAQELVPRAYWPAPTGTKIFVTGYQYSDGDVLTDPSLPVEGVKSTIEFLSLTYQQTFDWFGRTTNLQLNLPYAWGNAEGFVEGEFRTRGISNFADARARLSINLRGAPAMDGEGFQALRADPKTIVGASILVSAPTGDWEADKVINTGANRWAVKPAIGIIYPFRPKWLLEFEAGAWFIGDNDEFLGSTREQDPILSTEFHVIKRISPGFWLSFDVNYYWGGQTDIGGETRDDRLENSRVGATLVIPFRRQHAFRIAASVPLNTTAAGDFDTVTLAYAYVWR
jgi:hypothetical protein